MTEPRSMRLTQAHRNNTASAVINEWMKQNPAPAAEDHVAFLELVAEQFKKHATQRRTRRFIDNLEKEDFQHACGESAVKVRILNKQGEERRVTSVTFPLSLARRFGLAFLEGRAVKRRVDVPLPELAEEDKAEGEMAKCAVFVDAGVSMVQIHDDDAPMIQMREARKARQAWESQRDQLFEETRDLLDQFNTTKQLREGWPEIVPYLPPHVADPERAVTLPTMSASRLSERLGIKSEEEE